MRELFDHFYTHKEELASQSKGLKKAKNTNLKCVRVFLRLTFGYCGWMGHADFLLSTSFGK